MLAKRNLFVVFWVDYRDASIRSVLNGKRLCVAGTNDAPT